MDKPDPPAKVASNAQLGVVPQRACTCHPADKPPQHCAKRYALAECKAAARYPLAVECLYTDDTKTLMSKGHHDVHEFMRAVRADYSWPLGMPTHEWMRAIPAPASSGYRCLYVEAAPHSRGAFPATYVREAWGEDSYEAQAPNARVQAGTTAPQPDPERDEAARRGASPGTKC